VGFVVGIVALGQIFVSSSAFPCQYNSTVALHIHIGSVIWGVNNRPVGGRSSETQSQSDVG
jgi:hypothetical protein